MSVELKCVVIACIVGVLSSSALMTSLVAQCLTRCGSMPRATRRSRGHRRCSTACSGRASGSSPGPSSSAGSPNAARFGARPVSVIGRDQPPVAGGHDQLRHRRAEATALAGLADVGARCQQGLAIQQHRAAGGSCATSGGPVRGAWRLGHRECPFPGGEFADSDAPGGQIHRAEIPRPPYEPGPMSPRRHLAWHLITAAGIYAMRSAVGLCPR